MTEITDNPSRDSGNTLADSAEAQTKTRLVLVRGQRFVRDRVLLIPSCITVVGIFCGFLSILQSMKGNYEYSVKAIVLAMLLDAIDGRVARKLNAATAFGREFDSLSDVIAFGVGPAVLFYFWAFNPFADEVGIIASFLYVVCTAARLARFNVDTTGEDQPKNYFTGLPSPGGAAAAVAVVYAFPEPVSSPAVVALLWLYMIGIGALMVSTVPFISHKSIKFKREKRLVYVLALALFVGLAWKYSRLVLLLGGVGYALSGPILYLLKRSREEKPQTAANA